MDVGAVYAEIESQLATVTGLRVAKWGQKPQVPGAMLLLPDGLARTTHRGIMQLSDVVVLLLVGRADTRTSLTNLYTVGAQVAAVLDPAFVNVAAAIHWTTAADVTITEVTYDTASIDGVSGVYLAALFHLNITGA
jgi:hypothetical protein